MEANYYDDSQFILFTPLGTYKTTDDGSDEMLEKLEELLGELSHLGFQLDLTKDEAYDLNDTNFFDVTTAKAATEAADEISNDGGIILISSTVKKFNKYKKTNPYIVDHDLYYYSGDKDVNKLNWLSLNVNVFAVDPFMESMHIVKT